MANVDTIRMAVRKRPFRPFTIELVGGKSYTFRHPELVLVPGLRRPREIIVWTDDNVCRYVDVNLILEVVAAGPPEETPADAPGEATGEEE